MVTATHPPILALSLVPKDARSSYKSDALPAELCQLISELQPFFLVHKRRFTGNERADLKSAALRWRSRFPAIVGITSKHYRTHVSHDIKQDAFQDDGLCGPAWKQKPELAAAAPEPDGCRDQLGLVRVAAHHHSKKGRHHFFPSHLAVVDGLIR